MSEESETTLAETSAALTISVKLGRTVNLGNYENARYDVFISAPLSADAEMQTALAALSEQVRARLQIEMDYDKRVRDLLEEYSYHHGTRTAEEWARLAEETLQDDTLQPVDRRRILHAITTRLARQIERDDDEGDKTLSGLQHWEDQEQ